MVVRIAVLDDYENQALRLADWSALDGRAASTVFDRHLDEDEAVELLRDFEVLCLMRERMAMPASLLNRLPNLRFIAVTGVQNRTLDLAAARRLGLVVSHTERRGPGTFATAELAWGLILALARHLVPEAGQMRTGGWRRTLGMSLEGRTLGLVGLGRLGRAMVPVARAFHMRVLAWSQNLTEDTAKDAGAIQVAKSELFQRSDIVSLHLVLSERTRHVVDRAELDAMKPTAYLVNTARGPLVNRAALYEALAEGSIAGAALDTFDREPLPDDDPLRQLDRVILTPHIGYSVVELMRAFYTDTVDNIGAYLDGEPIRVLNAP